MESMKTYKGYGKVNDNPTGTQQSASNRRRRILLAASLTIFLTIVLGAMVGALFHRHESATDRPESEDQNPNSDSGEALKTVCGVTQYLDSCINSISALNDPPKSDPIHFFNLSLQVSLRELTNLSSLPKTLISKSNDQRAESALKDCVSLFDDSLSQLNKSAELMKSVPGPGEKLVTDMKISDMQTWISASMTDLETCLDGLDEMGSTVVDEVRARVHKSNECMSNSLAILNNLKSLVEKFGLTMP